MPPAGPYRVRSSAKNSLYGWAAQRGMPTILLELGVLGRWTPELIRRCRESLHNLMDFLGMTSVRRRSTPHSAKAGAPSTTNRPPTVSGSQWSSWPCCRCRHASRHTQRPERLLDPRVPRPVRRHDHVLHHHSRRQTRRSAGRLRGIRGKRVTLFLGANANVLHVLQRRLTK